MVAQALRQVFADAKYLLVAVTAALGVFILATWLPNLGLVWQIAASASVPLADKVKVLVALIGSIGTNFTVFSALATVAISVLFGTNLAMVMFFLGSRRQFIGQGGGAAGLGGLASGFFGIGCAACGTFVLGPVLSFSGASALIAFLPFGGQEFSMLGMGMLGFSLFLIAKKIRDPLACPVGSPNEAGPQRNTKMTQSDPQALRETRTDLLRKSEDAP